MNTKEGKPTGMEIAVIGMACRFPGARNYREFWENLKNGVESIRFFPDEELEKAGLDPELIKNPDFVKSGGGMLEDKEYFAASFFDYSPREAEIMDPQLRIFHECCWEALEDAGYDPFSYKGSIGLYAGASSSFYWETLVKFSGKALELGNFAADQLANRDYLTSRVSYRLNLKGANSTLNTACSTSLVALHQACRALLTAECKIAMAGGVSITASPQWGYMYREGMIMSRDGHTRAFDAGANGTNGGNGAGAAVLKLLKNALADGDYIHAVIKGTGANNDGNRKVGFTAPSVEGQSEAIRKALRMARVEPESITYIETHGTATPLGDPVEIEALKRAFKADELNKTHFCALGAVKTNIGHLDAAAGIAGFIKTVLALKHRQIPPSLNYRVPNPNIDFASSHFYVNTRLCEWKSDGNPRRAGVSSFGIGGTNVHVILEEWPHDAHPGKEDGKYQLILLSAKTRTALDRITENLINHFKENTGVSLADAAYTLQAGRRPFKYRRRLVCSRVTELIDALSSPDSRKVRTFAVSQENPRLIFMFPGLGAQYVNMGRELYETEPLFRREMDGCFEILRPLTEYDIKEILYPFFRSDKSDKSDRSDRSDNSDIHRTEITQPLLFIFEYALAKLLMHWGIRPYAMIGYSFGEYTAACVSGVFSLEDALKLVVDRGKLIRRIPGGAMLSIPLPARELEPFLAADDRLSLAIDNGDSCIAAGPQTAVDALEKQMNEKRILCMRLENAHAIHSSLMDPILQDFEEKMKTIPLREPQIPYVSNVSGDWIAVEEAINPGYWVKHLRNTVRFADGINTLLKEPNAIFLEVGPGTDLSTMIRRRTRDSSGPQVVNLVRNPQREVSDVYYLLTQLGNLWLYGTPMDWDNYYGAEAGHPGRVPLPVYPFERERFRIDVKDISPGTIPAYQPMQPQPPAEADIASHVDIICRMEEELEKQLAIKGIDRYPGLEAALNRFCTALICDYLNARHIGMEKGETYESKEELKQRLNLLPKFDKFLDFFVGVLAEDGVITLEENRVRFLKRTDEMGDPVELKQAAGEKYPLFGGLFESTAYCASQYPAALSGEVEAIGVLFPEGRYFRDNPFYRNQVEYDNTSLYIALAYRFILERVLPAFKRLNKNKRAFRVLEVGAGTGSLTRRLAAGLKEQDVNVEYHFTDIGKFFVVNAEKAAAQQGLDFMKFGVLDISRDPAGQGYETGSFDMILALNVVHATPRIEESIRNLERLLAPYGIMMLVEGTNPPRWMHMIDGLAEGWWYFEDEDIRNDSPLLSPGQWEALINRRGFKRAYVFPRQEEKRKETHCCMILARREAAVQEETAAEKPMPAPASPVTLYRRPELTAPYRAPRDEVEQTLCGIFQNFFGIRQVGIEDDFFELGMDSLIATVLAARIRQKLGITVPLAGLYQAADIERLGEYIKSTDMGMGTLIDENLVLLRKGSGPGSHLFLVHAGSGEVGVYLDFCNRLEPALSCWGIRADRIEHFAPRNVTVEEIAGAYLEKIQKVQPEGPYRIAGWSAGGAIAFEMVRLLEQRRGPVKFLGIISSFAPQEKWWYDAGKFTFESELKWLRGNFPGTDIEKQLKDRDIRELWSWVADYLETNHIGVDILARRVPEYMTNAIPGDEQLKVKEWVSYFNVIRTYMNAQAFYIPAGKIRTPAHFFEASGSEVFNREKWNDYTELPVKEYKITGTHHSIFRMPELAEFSRQFNRALSD